MSSRGDDVYRTLLDEIARQASPPGSALREEEIAARLSVSRTPVRDALARLKADGLISQQPGQIAIVAPIDTDNTIALYQLRDAIETYLVQLAAASPSRTRFGALADEYREHLASGAQLDADHLFDLGDRFDALLADAVPNALLQAPLASSRALLLRLRMQSREQPERLRRAAELRAQEADAIAAGDAELAADCSHQRIRESLRSLLHHLADNTTRPRPRPTLP